MPSDKDKEVRDPAALELFKSLGLDSKTAQNAVANPKVTANLTDVVREAGVAQGCDKSIGNLLYTVATKYPANALKHRPALCNYIITNRIKTVPQLEAAFAFLALVGPDSYNEAEFEEKCGVGVEVSLTDIKAAVADVIRSNKDVLLAERYRVNIGTLLKGVRSKLPWADGKLLKEELEKQMQDVLGEKTAADDEKLDRKKKEKNPRVEDGRPTSRTDREASAGIVPEENDPYSIFPKPQDNISVHTEIFFSDKSIWRPHNSRERLEKHLMETGGRVLTRFPPEPNGYLHIGHAKAMFIDFGLAKETGGGCYLRFDDTNPEAEKQEYIDHIQNIVSWLGWKPFKITYSSDYFQDLYELAVELIKRGRAYVDHQTADEIKLYRSEKKDSPWRDRPISESLKLFSDMRRGLIDEGKATLRMKQDMQNENFNMYDLIAYRIKFTQHPHAGDKWCIYPSYDYTHCIVDSLENITHSLCTLEFESRRASYYWLLDSLDLYLPYVWEYSRLSVANTVMSKRKLNLLVTQNYVDGWDDPRLHTLAGIRRRGFTPDAINAFCRGIGITRSDNIIRTELVEHYVRREMDRNCPRTMVVLKPLKVVVVNLKEGEVEELDAKIWPDDREGSYKVPFTKVLYIESSDFRLKDAKDYYGLAPGKSVLLRWAYPVKCSNVVLADDKETVLEVHVEYDRSKSTKPKGVIHWVAEPSPGVEPLKVEVRLFDKLFRSENPAELDDWLADLNPNSREVITDAYAVPPLKHAKEGDRFQFERLGYFCVDRDSSEQKVVFNRTVTLRDSYKPGSK